MVLYGRLRASPPGAKRLWVFFTHALAWLFLNPHRRRPQQSRAQTTLPYLLSSYTYMQKPCFCERAEKTIKFTIFFLPLKSMASVIISLITGKQCGRAGYGSAKLFLEFQAVGDLGEK